MDYLASLKKKCLSDDLKFSQRDLSRITNMIWYNFGLPTIHQFCKSLALEGGV